MEEASKTPAYYAGYEAKVAEIQVLGWQAARDEFNRINPPGQAWSGSADGLSYANGEFQALFDRMPSQSAFRGAAA